MQKTCFLITLLAIVGCSLPAADAPNTLTQAERAAGWALLFDGKSTQGWHSFKKESFPAQGWVIDDGWLHCLGKKGGDIVSEKLYDQFELTWEWKLESAGNSGVKYFVVPERGPIGHEYQLIDDARHPDSKLAEGKRVTAGFYDVLAPQTKTPTTAPGQTNFSRILVEGNRVEHWLNGQKVLEYELGSDAIKTAVAASKFNKSAGFGTRMKGHILLQDHNNLVWFRNIKIRDLSAR